jgi:aryl-phospho-beta-D-glucosidase BglC (GH1 family)
MANTTLLPVRADGTRFVRSDGSEVLLRGVCLGGWLNMENFITGYSANESLMRRTVADRIGADRADRFFERLLTRFFGEEDAAFLGEQGFTVARIAVGYKHFEDDARPFEIKPDAFRHLDRAIAALAAHGVYSIVDLHALPGSQNQHWHSDNETHRALFWEHPHFQDRVVHIWRAIAEHYRGDPAVAGYNLLNEPADETRAVVGPFYRRLVAAIREVDPDHTVFLDGNTYATEFGFFDEDPFENAVFTLHDYVPAGLGRSDRYTTEEARAKFLQRSEYARRTGTPILIGEFGPIYTGDEATDALRRRILDDQLALYDEFGASWALWMYKDLGRQGVVSVRPDTPYRRRFDAFVAKKERLGVDQWGSDGIGVAEVTQPVQDLVAREFPAFDPYPWGRFDFVRTLLLNITLAQPMAHEYADLFRGLDDGELDALADSFAFDACAVREPLRSQLVAHLDGVRA